MGANLYLIVGRSGSGKSSSLRYLNPSECALVTPNSKSLPIPNMDSKFVEKKNRFTTSEINKIGPILEKISKDKPEIKIAIVEDLNHYFNARVTSIAFRSRNSGNEAFARWNDFGADVANNIAKITENLRDDLSVIIFAHTDVKDDGKIGMKTSGKLLDNTIDIPSYVTCLLHAIIIEENGESKYKFLTNSDGVHLAKTPTGMFKTRYIPNDLKLVLNAFIKYNTGEVTPDWID